ncbi:SUKH-4 family immunity protein [Gordonia sp. NPDC003504]
MKSDVTVVYPESRQSLLDIGCGTETVEALCTTGIPREFGEEIRSHRRLVISGMRVVFSAHVSLGAVWVNATDGTVQLGDHASPCFVNSSLGQYVSTAHAVTDLAERFRRHDSEQWEHDADEMIAAVSRIDRDAGREGTYWDSVRESISIGDWASKSE